MYVFENKNQRELEQGHLNTEQVQVAPLRINQQQGASIAVKSSAVAIQSLLLGMHLAVNGKMLSTLSDHETGASSVVSTFQTLAIGGTGGFLLATGIELGKPVGKGDFKEAGHIGKSSWVLSVAAGGLTTIMMLATPYIFPLLYSQEASIIASDFFKGYAAAGIPSMLMISSPQIAFQAGEWYVPLVCGAMFYIPAAGVSYLLAFPANMGSFGVGLGGSVAGWLSMVAVQIWLARGKYADWQLYNLPINNLTQNLINLLKTGFQLSLQRLTEWGNLFAITTAIGLGNNSKYLSSTPPAIEYTAIFALSMQGLAHATAMLILRNKGKIQLAIEASNQEQANEWHNKNIRTLAINNGIGGLLGVAIAGIFYLERQPLSNLFIAPGTETDIRSMAATFLWINMLGAMPDAIRIISLGALRSWKDVLVPTVACLVTMTAVGVPTGSAISHKENDDWSYTFVVRDIVISLSALMMVWRCKQRIQNDKEEILEQFHQDREMGAPVNQRIEEIPENIPRSFLSYFRGRRNTNNSLLHNTGQGLGNPLSDDPTSPLLRGNSRKKSYCSLM